MTDPIVLVESGGPSWPAELEHIEAAPERLWFRGRMELLGVRPRVAIVGSRSPTPYGEAQAKRFAMHLARAGASIVSGMARGIDQIAHIAALEVGGTTLAVLGNGVDRPWPSGVTAERLVREGLLISEHPPGQSPRPHHFPLRNRLISGLSAAVIVIEAAHASGSLITARWAADQGRDVFALPGRVDHPMARGCHRILREGAALVEDPAEVASALGLLAPMCNESRSRLAKPAAAIIDALRGETLNLDELARATKRSPPSLLAELVRLELDEYVVRAPGGLYRLA